MHGTRGVPMTRKAQRRALIKPLKAATGLPFVTRATLAKALVRGNVYADDLAAIVRTSGAAFVSTEERQLDCLCCHVETVSYSIGERDYSFSSRYGAFELESFGVSLGGGK